MSMLLFVTHRLWSIFGDSGSVVSSVVSSDPALLSFHMLTGNLDRAPWSTGSTGSVGMTRLDSLRNYVRDDVDEFINAYLSVHPRPAGSAAPSSTSPRRDLVR